MPNWINNQITLVGKKEEMLRLINTALRNSLCDECETLEGAYKALIDQTNHKVFRNKKLVNGEWVELGYGELIRENGLAMSTFIPIPDTFLLYDTTNHPKEYEDAVKEQMEQYGVVGWYGYNLKTFGVKWDCDIQIDSLKVKDDMAMLDLFIETPWDTPKGFIRWIKDNYDLDIWFATADEGWFFLYFSNLGKDGECQKTWDYLPELEKISEEEDKDNYTDIFTYYNETMLEYYYKEISNVYGNLVKDWELL